MPLRKSWRLRIRSHRIRLVAPMLRLERCQSMGGRIRRAMRREKKEKIMAQA